MQVDHRHIPLPLAASKRKLAITNQNPFLLVVSKDFSFLTFFAETVLKYYRYHYQLHDSNGRQLMGYAPPLLIYENVILSEQALVQFLCDVALSNLPLDQFIGRKENVKRIYRAWKDIFREEEALPKGHLELLTRHDLSTTIYQELTLFSRDVVERGYQRVFPSYSSEEFSIETVLMLDIRQTILRHCPRDTCDYILRGGFPNIIDFQPDYAEKQLRKRDQQVRPKEEEDAVFVLLDGKVPQPQNLPILSMNLKWFTGVLVGLAFIFGKWAH